MTQPDGKQIKNGSILSTKLDATFLGTIVRADGSVVMTGSLDFNGNRGINLAAPVNANDAARLADINAIPWKDKVIAATTGNITLSGAQTIDGISLIAGDRCLVRAQSTGSQNGIYIVATGAWARSADADSANELRGAVVYVEQGTTLGDKRYAQTADNITLGTTALVWADIGSGTPAAFPTQSNKGMAASLTTADYQLACATTIASTPSGDGDVGVYVNGVRQTVGDGNRTHDCYFSVDGGTTPRSISNVAAGDSLYWVQSVALFNLATTDVIDFDYDV